MKQLIKTSVNSAFTFGQWFVSAAVFFVALTCTGQQTSSDPVSPDEYQILRTVLRSLTTNNVKIVVQESTFAHPLNDYEMQKVKKEAGQHLDEQTLEDFQKKNSKASVLLFKSLQMDGEIHWLTTAEYQRMKKSGGFWQSFTKRFPKAQTLASISRVGFDAAKQEAIVYLVTTKGGLAGEGVLFHVRKHDGEWQIRSQISLVIASNHKRPREALLTAICDGFCNSPPTSGRMVLGTITNTYVNRL